MKGWRVILAGLYIGLGGAVWWGLELLEPRAAWLKVDAPPVARIGEPFPIRVHLEPEKQAGFLTADLHWAKNHDRSELYLNTGGSRAVDPSGGTYEFAVVVQPRPGLCYVQVVLFLSRDGGWSTRTRVAASGPIEVRTSAIAASEIQPTRLRMASNDPTPAHQPPARWPHLLTGLLFATAAALAWLKDRSNFRPRLTHDGETSRRRKLTWSLSLSAVWEFAGAQGRLDALLREAAHREDLYYLRGIAQKVAISLVFPVAVLLLLQARRVRAGQRVFFAVFSLYLTLMVVDLVSLHAIDQVLDHAWHRITLSQALGLGCATFLLYHVITRWRSEPT